MRVAILPFYTIGYGFGVSEVHDFERYVERAEELSKKLGEPIFFYWLADERMKGAFPIHHDRCKVVWYPTVAQSYETQFSHAPARMVELFNEAVGQYPIDAVWTIRTVAAALISWQLKDWRTKSPAIPVFIDEFKVEEFGKGQKRNLTDQELFLRSVAYAVSYPIFNTEVEKELALRVATRYLSPAMVREIERRCVVLPHNVPLAKLRRYREKAVKHEKFTVFFGGRMSAAKHPYELAELMSKFYEFGRDVQLVLTCPSDNPRLSVIREKYPQIQIITQCSQDRFFQEMVKSHMIVSLAENEAFSNSTLQMLASGVPVLLPAEDWVRGLLGDEMFKKYPFLYERESRRYKQAAALMRYVYEHYDECVQKMQPFVEWVEAKFDPERCDWGLERMKLFQTISFKTQLEALRKYWQNKRAQQLAEKTLDDLLDKGEVPFSLSAFYDRMEQNLRNRKKEPRGSRWSRFCVYAWLRRYKGFVDLCDGPEPRFVPPDWPDLPEEFKNRERPVWLGVSGEGEEMEEEEGGEGEYGEDGVGEE